MRPEICKLLVPTIYPDLENHSNVYSYPPVKGLLKNIFFVNHSSPEKAVIVLLFDLYVCELNKYFPYVVSIIRTLIQ